MVQAVFGNRERKWRAILQILSYYGPTTHPAAKLHWKGLQFGSPLRRLMATRSAKLGVGETKGRKGLCALASIARDEILIDLNGEETLPSPTRRSLQIGEGKHAFGREETVGYLNHGCEPNAFLDFSCLCVKALKDIRAGEEVKINYAATEYEMHDGFHCNCGSLACLRMIRGFKFLTRDQQLKLKPYLAPYLLRRLDEEA
jgi:hypothetical protein